MVSFPSDDVIASVRERAGGILAVLGVFGLLAGILCGMGRPVICTCGTVELWQGDVFSPQVSQQLTDWYTLTHVTHGILLFAVLRWTWPEAPVLRIVLMALVLEAGWELVENTQYVIEYYRRQTMSQAYVGDTIINSLGDLSAMGVGLMLAYYLPVYASAAVVLFTETLLIWVIRDNLAMNLLMFIHPMEGLKQWQMAPAVQSTVLAGLVFTR